MRNLTEDYIGDWKKDPGERVCIIWTLWKVRIIDDYEFLFYQDSLWLGVLTQLLSFAIEWLLSHIELVVDAVGHNTIEEITDLRMFLAWNVYLNVYNSE